MIETPRVAIYARVSSEEQSLEGQERELRSYASSKGWEIAQVYSEKLSATGKVERDEYAHVLQDAAQPSRSWDHLLVWSLDRWSREVKFTQAIASVEALEALGVKFHSLKEPGIDSGEDDSPNMGRDLLRAILPVIATFESRRKAERVQLAMDEIKSGRRKTRSGKPPGRPVRATPEKVATILSLKSQGMNWKEIAQKVGLPRGTCANIASRERRGLSQNPPPSQNGLPSL
ncbi:MAG: recombinase family protein [Nitrososphaerota archaeon]|jgi:DNA invertase Pin-like site-specific DNA recombinase|nr:recombinase family protein [Nitrososphaerota archaeon]